MPSGTSGDAIRDSMSRKTAIRSTAAPSRPSVCAVSQPVSFPLTIA
jgi:hypothetical protein